MGVVFRRHVATRLGKRHLRSALDLLEIDGHPFELVARAVTKAQYESMRRIHLEIGTVPTDRVESYVTKILLPLVDSPTMRQAVTEGNEDQAAARQLVVENGETYGSRRVRLAVRHSRWNRGALVIGELF